MPINWDTFKSTTKTFFKSYTAQNEQHAAQFIATQYTAAILQGGDNFAGNVVIVKSTMTDLLASAIEDAFTSGVQLEESVIPQVFGTIISTGLIKYWTGAQLSTLKPPPGTTAIVPPNPVLGPGVVIPRLSVGATENEDTFINDLVDFFKQHLNTLQGTTIGLVPGAPPVPTPFPWAGYS